MPRAASASTVLGPRLSPSQHRLFDDCHRHHFHHTGSLFLQSKRFSHHSITSCITYYTRGNHAGSKPKLRVSLCPTNCRTPELSYLTPRPIFSPMPCPRYLVIFAVNRWLVSHSEDHCAHMPTGFCSNSNDSFLHNVINSNARHSGRGRTPLSSAE